MKILIVKTSSLGDIIQTFPAVQTIHKIYPAAQIDWVVEEPFKELVEAYPTIHRTLTVKTRKWRRSFWTRESRNEMKEFIQALRHITYDLVLDLQGNSKSGLITGLARSAKKVGFGYATVSEMPNLLFTHQWYDPPVHRNIREDYLFLVQSVIGFCSVEPQGIQLKIGQEEEATIQGILTNSLLQQGPQILVCPGSNWPNKQLASSTLQKFLALIQQQVQAKYLFIWGNSKEKKIADDLHRAFSMTSVVVNKLKLPTLQNLMSRVDLVIAMDSLPLHLAGTTSTPTFSVFGASAAAKYKPLGILNAAYQGNCPYGKTFEKRCPILRKCSTGKCIKDLEAEQLFSYFNQWWQLLA